MKMGFNKRNYPLWLVYMFEGPNQKSPVTFSLQPQLQNRQKFCSFLPFLSLLTGGSLPMTLVLPKIFSC